MSETIDYGTPAAYTPPASPGTVTVVTPRDTTARIPSLDGLRAIAILLVLLSHLGGTVGFPLSEHVTSGIVDFGNLGVRVFFVISGFLITGLLLAEHERTGGIALGRFYFRRTMRIMPPYVALVAVVAMLAAVGSIQLLPGDLLHAATYTMNYHRDRSWWLGHAWSLGVEEQFYLLWPLGLLLLGPRRGKWIAAGVILAVPLTRIGELLLIRHNPAVWHFTIGNSFETVADALAVGCLLALVRADLWAQRRYRVVLASRWCAVLPFAVLATRALAMPGAGHIAHGLYHLVGITVENVAIALMIEWAVRHPERRMGRWLNGRVLTQIGLMSYSLYLWQQLFLNRQATAVATRFPVNVLLACAVATASYYLIERPSLRLRARLQVRCSVAITRLKDERGPHTIAP